MDADKYMLTLHKYFIWADRMREHFYNLLNKDISRLKSMDSPEASMFRLETNIYMSYWYGGMYVLIEGWRELGFKDAKIDKLLDSPNVNLLKQYRNGVFHFQKDYFDKRFLGFIKSSDSPDWVFELRNEFSRFFQDRFNKNNRDSNLSQNQ